MGEQMIKNNSVHVTRGRGILEPLLAQLRADKTNKLIPSNLRQGRILDIGCGSYPYFLAHTSFAEKFSVDRQQPSQIFKDINWVVLDLNKEPQMFFEESYFEVITLLAVIEHLNPNMLVKLFQETYRVLKPGGVLILTTPASWSNGLLNLMAFLNLVSKEEIQEHVFTYTLPLLGWYFGAAGFPIDKVRFGYFEFNLNLWATAQK
jgi:SAM-dependent methyltransferase